MMFLYILSTTKFIVQYQLSSMNEKKLNEWIKNFRTEMDSVQISLDAYFLQKNVSAYYSLKIDKEHNNLILEVNDADELPNDIVKRITYAYEKSKPE